MIENEFKIMLTQAQYNAIRSLYSWDSEKEQINSYYDSPDLKCSDMHITVRVRSVSGKYLLQLKLPADLNEDNGALSRIELEKQLEKIPPVLSGSELKELCGAELPDVDLLGTLTTMRSVKHFPGAEIDLDRSEYFGKTDYELEVEYTDKAAAERILAEIAAAVSIDRNAPVTGKIRRFLEEYKKSNA